MAESKVSLRGLKCPLPALKARKLLARMTDGDVLIIECTDPLTTIDIPNLLRETGDQLEGSDRAGKVLTFRIRKGASGKQMRSEGKKLPRKK
jgi:tRNA 2-thiouridine synthesizing protein A